MATIVIISLLSMHPVLLMSYILNRFYIFSSSEHLTNFAMSKNILEKAKIKNKLPIPITK